jgi:hypothetical protein
MIPTIMELPVAHSIMSSVCDSANNKLSGIAVYIAANLLN